MEALSKNQADMTRQAAIDRLTKSKNNILEDFAGNELSKREISRKYCASDRMVRHVIELWLGAGAWESRPRKQRRSAHQTEHAQRRLDGIKEEVLAQWENPDATKLGITKMFKTKPRSLKMAIDRWLGDGAWGKRSFVRGGVAKPVHIDDKPKFGWNPTPTGMGGKYVR